MTQVAGYARISLDPSGDRLGVQRQLQDLRRLADQSGWTLVEYVDNNRSTAKDTAKRPAFDRMLADVSAGRVDVIAAWHLDRLARHPKQMERLLDVCEAHNTPIVTVAAGDLDLSTPAGRAVARTVVAWSGYEVEQKGLRQARRHQQNAEAGTWSGGVPPYGYRAMSGQLVEDPDQADIVREIVQRVLAGESLRMIARDLDLRGVPTRGRRWYPSTVRDIAAAPRYAALRVHRGKVVGPAQWPALIAPEVHAAVAQIIRNPDRRTTTTQQRSRLLSGLAACGVCGQKLVAAKSRRGDAAYRCSSRKHVTRTSRPVDDYVAAVVLGRLEQPDALRALAPDRADALEAQTTAETIRRRLEGLAEQFADDDEMTPDEYRAVTRRLRERLGQAEDDMRSAVQTVAPVSLDLVHLHESWQEMGMADRRRLVSLLMEVRVYPPGVGTRTFDPETVRIDWKS